MFLVQPFTNDHTFFASIEDQLLLIKMDLLIWSLNIRLELRVFVQLIFRMCSLLDMHYLCDSILSLSMLAEFGLSSRPLLSLYDTHWLIYNNIIKHRETRVKFIMFCNVQSELFSYGASNLPLISAPSWRRFTASRTSLRRHLPRPLPPRGLRHWPGIVE